MSKIKVSFLRISVLFASTLLMLSPFVSQAAKVGDTCEKTENGKFYLKDDRYCFVERLQCENGLLVFRDGLDRPVPPEMCPGFRKPVCPTPMEIAITLGEEDSLDHGIELLDTLSRSFFDLNFQISKDMNGVIKKPIVIEVKATPWFEAKSFWHFPLKELPTRDELKVSLEKKFSGTLKIEACPGVPQVPSVIGTN